MSKLKRFLYFVIPGLFFYSCNHETPGTGSEYQAPALKDIVMYEVNIRCFSSTADFAGITQRLDSIQQLGVNTLWLMPVYPVGQLNSVGLLGSPYAVQNYTAVNPEFGAPQDLEDLIAAAHARNMAVMLDWVANHTAWDNAWIENTDWYTQDAYGNIISPAGTGWLDVADLNFENADMRLAMINAMRYWVRDFHIDGFRCDAADFVPFDFWQQAIDSLHKTKSDIIMLAEGGRADHFTAGFDMNYAWDFYGRLKNIFVDHYAAYTIFSTNISETILLPAGKYKLRFTTNHDETAWDQTPVAIFGGTSGALAASVITIFMNGIPLLYNGQEVGSSVNLPIFSDLAINWDQNPDMLAAYKKILSLYSESEVLKQGTITQYNNSFIVAFKKSQDQSEAVILVNTQNETKDFTVPAEIKGIVWRDMMDDVDYTFGDIVSQPAYGFKIYTRSTE